MMYIALESMFNNLTCPIEPNNICDISETDSVDSVDSIYFLFYYAAIFPLTVSLVIGFITVVKNSLLMININNTYQKTNLVKRSHIFFHYNDDDNHPNISDMDPTNFSNNVSHEYLTYPADFDNHNYYDIRNSSESCDTTDSYSSMNSYNSYNSYDSYDSADYVSSIDSYNSTESDEEHNLFDINNGHDLYFNFGNNYWSS